MRVLLTVTAIMGCLTICALCTWGIISLFCVCAEELTDTLNKLKKK